MKILLLGVGNLGERYIEGLLKLKEKIFFYDNNISRINHINKKFSSELNKSLYPVKNLKKLEIIKFDVCIISTTASNRHLLVKKILRKFKIKYWILEKLVSNRINNLKKINDLLKNSIAYVNLPRTYDKKHILLKKNKLKKIDLTVDGGNWNIACNCIHHLFLLEWYTGDKIIKLNFLKKKIYLTKRKNFYDFYGKITAYTNHGSKVVLSNLNNNKKFTIKIKHLKDSWFINEHKGLIKKNGQILMNNQFNYQSFITPIIVKSLSKNCKLPLLKDIYHLHHKILIEFNKLRLFNVT